MSQPNVCENCGGDGVYVASTRPDQNGEPQEVNVICECQDYEDFEE